MEIEGVLLTGGASRRMGADKAHLNVDGQPLAERIANGLLSYCSQVTVLGNEAIAGCEFLADADQFAGPLAALSRFTPTSGLIFVASCDLPRFDGRLIPYFAHLLNGAQGVLPHNDGHVQPLCSIYTRGAWSHLQAAVSDGKKSLMAWLERIQYRTVTPEELGQAGLDPRAFQGANSPEELAQLLK